MCSAAAFHASYMLSTLYSYMQCNYIGFNIASQLASCLEFLLSAILFVKLAKCGGVASYMYASVHLSLARPLFSVFICGGGKRVWSNDQGGLVSRTPRISRRANHSDRL